MWWLKCLGSLWIIAGCGYLGWIQSAGLNRRIGILREMNQSLGLFKSLTGTYRMPLYQVFFQISEQTKGPVAFFYKKMGEEFERQEGPAGVLLWKQTLEATGGVFDRADRERIAALGNFIGIQDIRVQAAAVDECIQELRELIFRLEGERPEKEKLYRVLSLTVGGFLVIFFI